MVVELKITGMHCAGCVASVENALRKVEGVEEAVVNLTLEKATVLGSLDPTQLIQSVDQTGYSAEIIDGGTGIDIQEKIDEKVELAFSHMKLAWIFTLPAMIWMSVHMTAGVTWPSLEAMDLGIEECLFQEFLKSVSLISQISLNIFFVYFFLLTQQRVMCLC